MNPRDTHRFPFWEATQAGPFGRRRLLRLGAGCFGLSLPAILAMRSQAASASPPATAGEDPLNPGLVAPPAKAKSIIHIFLPGALPRTSLGIPSPTQSRPSAVTSPP